ncbi:hypothetical protein PSHT_16024 [Puccinia striiformis]|uniref:Uncharacterized protein n=1 Tax=Puccinia striiformis TaxID=27350 RepID=A0A2S4UBW2_9BASI|nr:hypothetical protein PSHT_16024 [Puccinia striiformis]
MGPYTPTTAIAETLRIATTKLLCTSTAYLGKLTDCQIFALLGSVIQTRISSHSSLNSALVLKHAARSANGFLASNETHWIGSINTLTDAIQTEVVSLGNVGGMTHMRSTWDRLRMQIELNSWIFNHFTRINYIPNQAHFMEFLYREKLVPFKYQFFGIRAQNDHSQVDWGIVINGLKAMLESKTSHRILILSYYSFPGLEQISCLSPEIRAVLTCLMNAAPEDVLQFLKSPDDHTVQWAKHVNPLFYGRHQPNLDRITNRQTSLHLVECIHTQNGTQTQLCRSTEIPHGDGDRREINLYFIRLVNSF